MIDGLCAGCCHAAGQPEPTQGGMVPRERGYCTLCGYYYDIWGIPILDITVRCRVHTEILATCPHSGALSE